uniref:ABC transporter substrate-binding protein n=1 Tax=Gongylonema pulchrum TaxID=637853 RepID=A0A183DI26_9BILA
LVKDYEVNVKRLAEEKQIPLPEPIDYAALGYFPDASGGSFVVSVLRKKYAWIRWYIV